MASMPTARKAAGTGLPEAGLPGHEGMTPG